MARTSRPVPDGGGEDAARLDHLLYAAQLGQGVSSLRFAPPLEGAFRDEYFQRGLQRLRSGFAMAIGLYVLFLTLRLLTESGPGANLSLALRTAIIGCMLGAVVASYSLERVALTRVVVFTYLAFGAGVTAIECVAHLHQIDRRYEGLIFISVHCFVFGGLLFRTACLTALGIFLIYAYGGWLGGLAGKAWGYELFFMALINILGSVSLYSLESTERENFLRRHMLLQSGDGRRLTGVFNPDAFAPHAERRLATVLFTDIVASTAKAAELGDRAWKHLLEREEAAIRRVLRKFGGKEVESAGDGLLVLFDQPAQAVRCADAMRRAVRKIGLQLRIGIHTGELELEDDRVRGIAVHIAARIAQLAGADEVLVSRTVCDLVCGSGLQFTDRGAFDLKGVPEPWQLYQLTAVDSLPANDSGLRWECPSRLVVRRTRRYCRRHI